MTSAVGMIEALSGIIGEADGDIGGIPITRLTAPVSDAAIPLNETIFWNGSEYMPMGNTDEVTEGDWVRLDSDGQYFKIIQVDINAIGIENPQGLVIPTGSTLSSKLSATSFPVETTLGFSSEGKISIDGVVYNYESKTNTSFDGITYLLGGSPKPGALKLHRIEAGVYDRNRDRSALDLVRRAMLVEYAEGEDLNALGRNLGVLRSAFLTGDDQFREIIKVLAYNPKGTLLGLTLALTGLVGEGNFEIYEDLINNPAKVFITLSAGAIISDSPLGSTYLEEAERLSADSDDQVTTQHPLAARGDIESVLIAPEYLETPLSTFPDGFNWEPYPDATPIPVWDDIGGGALSTVIKLPDVDELEFTGNGTDRIFWQHDTRIALESRGAVHMWMRLLDNGSGAAEAAVYNRIVVYNGKYVEFGWTQLGSVVNMGFLDGTGTGVFQGSPIAMAIDSDYHHLELRYDGAGNVGFYWDGVLQQSIQLASQPAGNGHRIQFGVFSPAFTPVVNSARWRLRALWHEFETPTNLWASYGTDGDVSAGTRTLASASLAFLSSDVGKGFTTYDSQVVNAEGGNNNGRWLVESQGGTDVTLIGETWMGASVQGVNPTRIVLPLDQPLLQYPDDLGKEIEIIGSSLGNDGIYVIDKLLDPVTLTDIELGDTPTPVKTRYCEVIGATFLSETDLSWRLRPNFAAETGLKWKLEASGSYLVTGFTNTVLTLRQPIPNTMPDVTRVWDVTYAQVLSGQLLRDASVSSTILSLEPLQVSHYPFYLADPLGYARDYLSSVTAAGVIPDFEIA